MIIKMLAMENSAYYEILTNNVKRWNSFVRDNPDVIPDFTGADLSDSDLRGAVLRNSNFENADMRGAALSGADLAGSSFVNANVSGTDFSDSRLADSDFTGANIRGAFLSDANLDRVDFTGTNLYKAHCNRTSLLDANFLHADLTEADFQMARLDGICLDHTNLSGADFSGSSITGASIVIPGIDVDNTSNTIGSVFLDVFPWIIEGITCEYIYLDREKKHRYPENRIFATGEFEHLFYPVSVVEYVSEQGIHWYDSLVIQRIVSEIRQEYQTTGIYLISINQNKNTLRVVCAINNVKPEIILSHIDMQYKNFREKIEKNDIFLHELARYANMQVNTEWFL